LIVRLGILDSAQRLRARIFLSIMRIVAGTEDAVVRTSLYKPELFGRSFLGFTSAAMRGPSAWSAGERELFAAFVSQLNACPYCLCVHTATTALTFDSGVTADRLRHWRDTGFSGRIAAMLAFLEKLNQSPGEVRQSDIAPLRAAGLSDAAIVDALNVSFVFNTVNRLANAFGFDWEGEGNARKGAVFVNRAGYRIPGFLLR
jgi:uncharacterized peroxidase-related enzyme